jgi:hypothetical protein
LTCQELSPEYVPYALGVADETVRNVINRHLVAECPACTRGVASANVTVAAMYGALQISQPPKYLRRRVVAAVERNPKRPLAGILIPWAIVAALSLALVSIGLTGRRQTLDAPRLEQALFILNDPATKDVTFGQPGGKDPGGRVFVNATTGFVFIARNLPRIPDNKTFALWIVTSNSENPMTAGVFQAQSDGTAIVVRRGGVSNPKQNQAEQIQVTIEPSGGSPQPTTSPILVTNLNK